MKQDNTTTLQNDKGFTPGEWEEIGGDSKSRYIHANKPDGTLGKIVATAHGETLQETKANAALIASAPTLKAENENLKLALSGVLAELGEYLDAADNQFGREENEAYQKGMEALNQTKQD